MLEFLVFSILPLIGAHVVGLFFLVLGFIGLRQAIRLVWSGRTPNATVVRIDTRADEDAQFFAKMDQVVVISYPVFRFIDHTGETREIVSPNGSSELKWKVGDETSVLFDSNDLSTVVPNRPVDTWLTPLLVMLAGAAVITFGWLVVWKGWDIP